MSDRDIVLANALRRALIDPAAVGEDELARALDDTQAGIGSAPDRRGSARMGVEVPAELRDAQHPEAYPRQALITDVCPGGVRMRVRGVLAQSGDVVLELRGAHAAETLRVPGRLTWARPERWSTCLGFEVDRESSFAWFGELRELARQAAARPGGR